MIIPIFFFKERSQSLVVLVSNSQSMSKLEYTVIVDLGFFFFVVVVSFTLVKLSGKQL